MSDYNSSLPVRTESAGDLAIKVVDATITSQQLKVNADGSIDTNFAPGAAIEITDGTDNLAINGDGSLNAVVTATNLDIRDLAFATDKVDVTGSEVSLDSATLAALESITVQNGAGASAVNIQDGGNSITVDASDLDIRDLSHSQDSVKIGDGTDFLAVNTDGSINVVVTDSTPGTAVNDYDTDAAVAGGATGTHTYTSTGNFYLTQIEASASGKMKIVVKVNGATKFVQFNSTSETNMSITLSQPILATTGQTVTVERTNRDNQAQDVYSTISGYTL